MRELAKNRRNQRGDAVIVIMVVAMIIMYIMGSSRSCGEEERIQQRVEQEIQRREAEKLNTEVSEGLDEVLETAEE